jgi:hypothetical protein
MYRSKEQIEKKLAQAKYVFNQIQRYRGKIFVNNGIDDETGASPLQVHVSSFLAHTRSVLQYAYKECEVRENLSAYEAAVSDYPIIKVFRDLRNIDIHEMVIGTHTVVSFKCRIFKTGDEATRYSDENSSEPNVVNHISIPIIVTTELVDQLRSDGKDDLPDAATEGKSIYQSIEFNGEKDLHVLCKGYIDSISLLVNNLSQQGAIS